MLSALRAGNKRTKVIWIVLTVATVFTFVIGFSFFGSMGSDANLAARRSGVYGSINGEKIDAQTWQNALSASVAAYRQQYGSDPADRDLKAVEQRAWRNLVNERLFTQVAKKAGIKVTDNDVIVGMQTSPPAALYNAEVFQTNGKFDPQKYQAALANPNNDWSPYEAELRRELPVRMLQERLLSSIKLTQDELRQAWLDRSQRMTATALIVPPAPPDTSGGKATEAQLQAVFDRYRTRLATPARTQVEYVMIPVQYSQDEIADGEARAKSLYDRAEHGEDWYSLVRDNSEGPNASTGGVIDRFLHPQEMGPIGAQIEALPPGGILAPYREGGSIMVFKKLDPASDSLARNAPAGTFKVAQLMVKLRASSESMTKQYDAARNLAKRAEQVGLSKAATEKGLATQKTPMFDENNLPPQLSIVPDAADWALSAKQGEVSPVFTSGGDAFVVEQVSIQHAAGPPTREELGDQLQQLYDIDRRVQAAKPKAEEIAKAVQSGKTLEQAAKEAGLSTVNVTLSRAQPDPRLNPSPELQGALWAAKIGETVGPFQSLGGWYFGRPDQVTTPPDSTFTDQVKGQLTNQILQQRQRTFFDDYLSKLRHEAKIVDNRRAFLSD